VVVRDDLQRFVEIARQRDGQRVAVVRSVEDQVGDTVPDVEVEGGPGCQVTC
jgi:hypothetical protein